MLMEAHFQPPLLAQFPGGREPQKRCTSCPAVAATTALPQRCLVLPCAAIQPKYSLVYSNVNFSWANEMRTEFRLHFDFLCAERVGSRHGRGTGRMVGQDCTQNELPAISFRVLIFNHTTTQTQKKGWQSKVAESPSRGRGQTIGGLLPDKCSRPCPASCASRSLLLDPGCVFESPVIVAAAINARASF